MLCKDDKRVTVKINRHNFKKKRWSRDEDHKECFKCKNSFNLFRRRHQYVFEAYLLFSEKISQQHNTQTAVEYVDIYSVQSVVRNPHNVILLLQRVLR